MKNVAVLFLVWQVLIISSAGFGTQIKEIGEGNARPAPEIKRLFEALGGDWDTTETFERTQFFPNGGERKGGLHVRLAADGAMLVMEGHSDGSAGPLVTSSWSGGTGVPMSTAISPASKTQAAAAKSAAPPSGRETNSSTTTKRSPTAKE